jgi:ubiquinone/menaquinone biosynthesis C-methylase UbiE
MVDVGCGAGRHLLLAAMGGASVVGVDLSIEGLREAAKRLRAGGHGVALVRASMSDLALQRESADVMVAYGSLYYSDESSYQAAVAELWRVLRAEGHALVVTRTTRDSRFSLGEQLEPRTVRITSAVTNERGMIMHFLDRPAIDDIFSGFSKVTVDWVEHTSGGGTVLNSDWVIELKK